MGILIYSWLGLGSVRYLCGSTIFLLCIFFLLMYVVSVPSTIYFSGCFDLKTASMFLMFGSSCLITFFSTTCGRPCILNEPTAGFISLNVSDPLSLAFGWSIMHVGWNCRSIWEEEEEEEECTALMRWGGTCSRHHNHHNNNKNSRKGTPTRMEKRTPKMKPCEIEESHVGEVEG